MAAKEKIRLRAPRPEDKFGDPTGTVPDWRDVNGATVVPRSSSEYEQRGTIIISGFMIRVPRSTAVQNGDEVEVRGKVYQIEGEIGDFGRPGKIFYVKRPN